MLNSANVQVLIKATLLREGLDAEKHGYDLTISVRRLGDDIKAIEVDGNPQSDPSILLMLSGIVQMHSMALDLTAEPLLPDDLLAPLVFTLQLMDVLNNKQQVSRN